MKHVFKTIVLFLLISINVDAQAPSETIPPFSFLGPNKSLFTNKDLISGKLLFFVFFDSECEHCQHAIKYISGHNQEFKKIVIYLITMDDQEKVNRFMDKYGKNLKGKNNVTLLQDFKNEFITRFRPRKYPSLFLYSEKKVLIMYEDNEQNLFRFSKEIKERKK